MSRTERSLLRWTGGQPETVEYRMQQKAADDLRAMVTKTLDMLPNAVAAFVIGGVGWIVATVLRNLTANLSRTAGIDQLGGKAGLAESVKLSSVVGTLVFVVVFIPSLIAALDALKIEAISLPATRMLAMLLEAVPHIIAAALILVITWMVASFAARLLASLLALRGRVLDLVSLGAIQALSYLLVIFLVSAILTIARVDVLPARLDPADPLETSQDRVHRAAGEPGDRPGARPPPAGASCGRRAP